MTIENIISFIISFIISSLITLIIIKKNRKREEKLSTQQLLKIAIEKGNKLQIKNNQLLEKQKIKNKQNREKLLRKEKARLLKNNYIYNKVANAIGNEWNHTYINSEIPFITAEVINSIDDLKAELVNEKDIRVTWRLENV